MVLLMVVEFAPDFFRFFLYISHLSKVSLKVLS